MGEAIHDDMDGGLLQDKRHASPLLHVLYVSKNANCIPIQLNCIH